MDIMQEVWLHDDSDEDCLCNSCVGLTTAGITCIMVL
jgi:hypothetical protein